ncbi:MAG: hypothetical protein KGL39_19890 [Patescibacteria group bacterium]|nr:hypothetical protein [Patescibacteria group bacterium]
MEQRHRDVLGCDRHELLKLLSGKSPKFTRDEKLAMIDEFARRTEAHSFVLFVPAPIQQRIDLAVANTSSAGLAAAENIRTIGGNQ